MSDLSKIKKFFRDGARYICSHCKAKYFTKIEVEQCFDGHGDEAIKAWEDLQAKKKKQR